MPMDKNKADDDTLPSQPNWYQPTSSKNFFAISAETYRQTPPPPPGLLPHTKAHPSSCFLPSLHRILSNECMVELRISIQPPDTLFSISLSLSLSSPHPISNFLFRMRNLLSIQNQLSQKTSALKSTSQLFSRIRGLFFLWGGGEEIVDPPPPFF